MFVTVPLRPSAGLTVLADLALVLAVLASMTAPAAVVLLVFRRSALRGARTRRCPRRGAGAR